MDSSEGQTLLDSEINVLTNRFSINGLKVEEILQTIAPTHRLQRTVLSVKSTTVLMIDFNQHKRPQLLFETKFCATIWRPIRQRTGIQEKWFRIRAKPLVCTEEQSFK